MVNEFSTTNLFKIGKNVLRQEAEAVYSLMDSLDETFEKCIQLLLETQGRIIFTGIGKSGHIARKTAATFSATGTPAYFIHPVEASHGDLGLLLQGDVLIVFSKSGETVELKHIVEYAERNKISIVALTENEHSILAKKAHICMRIPRVKEACELSQTPTTSAIMCLALGDALAVTLLHLRDLERDDLLTKHPGGALGNLLK